MVVLSSFTAYTVLADTAYFEEKITLREAKKNLKQNTRQYARRQMTWFRKDKSIQWIKNAKEANRLIKKFLQQN